MFGKTRQEMLKLADEWLQKAISAPSQRLQDYAFEQALKWERVAFAA